MAERAPVAELSSIATALDELTRRLVEVADRHSGSALDALAQELYGVERSLGEARRRLRKALRRAGE
jgi:hypothetical protein